MFPPPSAQAIPEIDDELSDSLVKTYSINKLKKLFQPKSYEVKLYGNKEGHLDVSLTKDAPNISQNNYVETIETSNIAIDFVNGVRITFIRVSEEDIKLSNKSITDFNLLVAFNRNCSVEYGAIMYANDIPISTHQTFGNQDFNGVNSFSIVQPLKYELKFDLLTEEVLFRAGTVFKIELFKRQEAASPTLTTHYLFGVNENELNRISYSKVKTMV